MKLRQRHDQSPGPVVLGAGAGGGVRQLRRMPPSAANAVAGAPRRWFDTLHHGVYDFDLACEAAEDERVTASVQMSTFKRDVGLVRALDLVSAACPIKV